MAATFSTRTKGPFLSQHCDLWGLAACQQWVFRSGHSSLGNERGQSGLTAEAPPGERRGSVAGLRRRWEDRAAATDDFLCTEVGRAFRPASRHPCPGANDQRTLSECPAPRGPGLPGSTKEFCPHVHPRDLSQSPARARVRLPPPWP